MRRPFTYKGCTVSPETMPEPTLAACNNGINRYLKTVWRAIFPDQTWCRVGTKHQARQYINENVHKHAQPTPA